MALNFEIDGVDKEQVKQETAIATLDIKAICPRFEDYKKEAEKIASEAKAVDVVCLAVLK